LKPERWGSPLVQEKYQEKRPVTRGNTTTTTTATATSNNNNNNKWTVKTKVIPVTIGATGTITKSFGKFLINIPGKHKIKELQQTAILCTTHVFREVLM
jgi:hypothetical protein